jgi:hypothetical protein
VAVVIVGAAAAGVTFIAPVGSSAPQIQPVTFGVPSPLEPAGAVPTPDQLVGVLNSLQEPGFSFASKGYPVQGGIGPTEARAADGQVQKAVAKGQPPLTFSVANVQPAGPGAATADVTASGPALAPTTRNVTFVNQAGWKISRGSVMALLREAGVGA